MTPTLSIVIPCYNEEESLPHLRAKLCGLGAQLPGHTLEFVFVDDGSTDGTAALLAGATDWGLPGSVQVRTHRPNAGLGAALQTGFRAATGALVAPIDCDGTLDPGLLPAMIAAMDDGTDIVSGSDLHPDGACRGVPWLRLVLHRRVSTLYRWLFWSRLHSFSSILRVYRRSVVETIDIKARGFVACTEILMRALAAGYTVREFPLTLTAREHGTSKIRIARTIRDHLQFMLALRLSLWRQRLRQPFARPPARSARPCRSS
jgi:dolichol-phosphate mannosyltransferase